MNMHVLIKLSLLYVCLHSGIIINNIFTLLVHLYDGLKVAMDLLECESKQTPLRVLYAFFNYVSLGQWQLARVCIRRLDEELAGGALILDQSDPVEVRSLLRTIVLYPNTIW